MTAEEEACECNSKEEKKGSDELKLFAGNARFLYSQQSLAERREAV